MNLEKFPENINNTNEKEPHIDLDKLAIQEKGFIEGLRGKSKLVAKTMVLCTLLAGTVSLSKAEAGDEIKRHTISEKQKGADQNKYSGDERMQRRIEQVLKKKKQKQEERERWIKRASELAGKMGIDFDSNNPSIKLEGFVPTHINEHNVPLDLLTDDERESVEKARKIKRSPVDSVEDDEIEDKNKKQDPSVTITKGNEYMKPSDF
ncbi:MAG: hypothetical protein CMI55_03185 [Parcubacteria group bacterium]|jgi:hypothetical protein|nr:hypothetical protein [Parcubacteria group bacterium]|tara:strand:- start:3246 stop:3866 length:621 start_codon:yes stop_codon:yes gene_type:complete